MNAVLEEKVEYESAKRDEKRGKRKIRVAKLRLKVKKDEEKIKEYISKVEYIEEKHLGRIRSKIDVLNDKIKNLQHADMEMRVLRFKDEGLRAAKKDVKKAKNEKHIDRLKIRISHLNTKAKFYMTKMEYIEEKHIKRLKARIEKHKSMIKDLEHLSKW